MPASSASSLTSGHGSPSAWCRNAIRRRSATAASLHGSRPRPSRASPSATAAATASRRRIGERDRGQLDRAEPGDPAGHDPALRPGDLVGLQPGAGCRVERDVLVDRCRRADRGVPRARPSLRIGDRDPRHAGQGRVGGAERRAGARDHQVGRRRRGVVARCVRDGPGPRRCRPRGRRSDRCGLDATAAATPAVPQRPTTIGWPGHRGATCAGPRPGHRQARGRRRRAARRPRRPGARRPPRRRRAAPGPAAGRPGSAPSRDPAP